MSRTFVCSLGVAADTAPTPQAFDREREFDRPEQHVHSRLDMERVRAMIWPG